MEKKPAWRNRTNVDDCTLNHKDVQNDSDDFVPIDNSFELLRRFSNHLQEIVPEQYAAPVHKIVGPIYMPTV